MNQHRKKSDKKEKNDIEIPIITTSSPSMSSESDLLPLPVFKERNKHARDLNSSEIIDDFDSTFANNNNTTRRLSFLRSPTPNNLNSSSTSRGVSSYNENFIFFHIVFIKMYFVFRNIERSKMVSIIDECSQNKRTKDHTLYAFSFAKV